VRQLTIKRLKLIGYRVLEASDGPAALEILKRGDDMDLVFTDLIMPGGLSGREVATGARQLKPGVKVSLPSGYAELVHGDELQREQLRVLRKPYQQADLAAALRAVLGDGTANADPDNIAASTRTLRAPTQTVKKPPL
jgi:CheY-like chemotaxis protein